MEDGISGRGPDIVLIGAGSASFGLHTLSGIMRTPGLRGARLSLVDTDPEGLGAVEGLARRMADEWSTGMTVRATTDRRTVLPGADFVVLSVAVDRERTWQRDRDLARARGIEHYGENGGPGGFFHTARNVALLLPILRDVEAFAPEALVVNFTNPLPRLCGVIARATKLRFVGLCHQLGFGYMVAAVALADELGLDVPDGYVFRWTDERVEQMHALSAVAEERLAIRAAGLNHFTWMLDVRERETGRDLLPALRENLLGRVHAGFEPLTRRLAEATGHVPVSGDAHLCEYLPYTRGDGWERYDVQAYDHAWSERVRQRQRAWIADLAAGRGDLEPLRHLHTERGEQVIDAAWNHTDAVLPAVDVPNRGAIPGLPDDAIIEAPGVVGRDGIHPLPVGPLPPLVTEWCRREAAVADLCVQACLERSRQLAREALLLDPTVDDLDVAEALLDAYLEAHRDGLGEWH